MLLHQITGEITLLLIMYTRKHHKKAKQAKFSKDVRAICNLHQCYNFVILSILTRDIQCEKLIQDESVSLLVS